MDNAYDLDGKSFVVERNDGEGTLLPPGSRFDFKHSDGEISATYSGGRVAKGTLTGQIIEDRLHHRYSEILKDGRRLTGRATLEIIRRESGLLELRDHWAWESQTGEGLCLLIEISETVEDERNTDDKVLAEELTKETA